MKILHLLYESAGDYFGIGGAGVRAYEIYGRLKDRHDITLLCKKYQGASDGTKEGLKHLFVGIENRSLTKTLLSYGFCAAHYVKRHGNDYDIVVEDFSPAIPTFLHAFTRKPVVLQVQGFTGKLYFRKYNPVYASFLYAMETLRPRLYDNFIFMNKETMERFPRGKRGCAAIIANGVPGELLDTEPCEGEYILFLGRIDIYGKGLDTLLDAYRTFHTRFPDIRLVIAGDGRDRQAFDKAIGALPAAVRDRIDLPGWVSGSEKADVIRRAHFAVFPSRHEVQPIAALEVMACGKAVVVSDLKEFRFATDKGAGISFETGNALSLARSMEWMMANNERQEMGRRGRDIVREFTWDKAADEYERFLDEVSKSDGDAACRAGWRAISE